MRTKKPFLTLLALLAALSLVAAACGSDDDSSSDTTEASSETTEASTDTTAGSDTTEGGDTELELEPVGPACDQVPTDGEGSSAGMADDPVGTAASNNPLLSTLVAAVTAADLVDTLNDPDATYTIFAPIDPAFEALPEGTVETLTMPENQDQLTAILGQHVITEGSYTIDELVEAGTVTAFNEGTDTIEASGETATVVGDSGEAATIVCGNVQTANATVHLIDTVLMPAA